MSNLTREQARQILLEKGVPEDVVMKVFPMEFTFILDGDEHSAPTESTGCCATTGRPCKQCNGWMHYQPEHGGYFYRCEQCLTFGI